MLITPAELDSATRRGDCVVFDCRFDLASADAGFAAYLEGHVPGAVYAHLDRDLAGPMTATSGRHPLPDPETFAGFLARAGWRPGSVVVAYDTAGGAFAARLWWLMKYFGHDGAHLLDGGWAAWLEAGFPSERGEVRADAQEPVQLRPQTEMTVSTADIEGMLGQPGLALIDARAPERFNGDTEPLDPAAGHVPGAVNRPFTTNLGENQRFREPGALRAAFDALAGGKAPEDVVYMCGSGVTACHNLFAAELAGLPGSKLYVGSWSEWSRDPARPIA